MLLPSATRSIWFVVHVFGYMIHVATIAAMKSKARAPAVVADDIGRASSQVGSILFLLSKAGCEQLDDFDYDDGGEFPGVQGALSCCPDTRYALCVGHNFTNGGHYNGAKLSGGFLAALGQARPEAFVFDIAAQSGAWLGWSMIDATGQIFPTSIPYAKASGGRGGLRRVRLPLNNATFRTHYGGANDGHVHLPLMGLIVQSSGNRNTNTIGQLKFANLSLEFASSASIPPAAVLTLSASTNPKGAVAQQGAPDPLALTLSVQNRLQATSGRCHSWAKLYGPGSLVTIESQHSALLTNTSTVLSGWGRIQRTAFIQTSASGYFPIQLGLECSGRYFTTIWHGVVIRPGGAADVGSGTGGVGEVTQPLPCSSVRGVFGLNNIGGSKRQEAASAAAIGVRTIRHQVIWRYTVDQDNPSNDTFVWGAYDAAFEAATAHNMSVLLNLFPLPPARFANGSRPALPRSDTLLWLSKFAAAAADRYGQQNLLGVSVDNEPDGSLWLRGGTGSYANRLPVDEAAGIYNSWLSAVKHGVLQALGTERVEAMHFGGLSVSGGEWSLQNLTFVKSAFLTVHCMRKSVASIAAKDITLFTGHPYTCNKHLGCSGDMFTVARQWIFPSDSDGDGTLMQKLQRVGSVLEDAGTNPSRLSLWPSEFGWALERNATPTSLLALGQAAAVSQGLVLMRALAHSPRYGPFYLFAAEEAGLEGGAAFGGMSSFGLWRTCESVGSASFSWAGGRRYPLPAAAAYATASALLELPTSPTETLAPPCCSMITWATFERAGSGDCDTSSAASDARNQLKLEHNMHDGSGGGAVAIVAVWLRTAPEGVVAPGKWNSSCIVLTGDLNTTDTRAVYSGTGEQMPTTSTHDNGQALLLELSPLPTFVVLRPPIGDFLSALSHCATEMSCQCQPGANE